MSSPILNHTKSHPQSTNISKTMLAESTSSRILTMPSEILALVAEQCEEETDLQALRLTCKPLCDASRSAFGKAVCSMRFIFTEYSMKGLVDLTESAFVPYLRKLSFGTCRLAKTRTSYDLNVNDRHEERRQEQEDFIHSGRALKMLVQAFQNIKKHNTVDIELGVHDDIWHLEHDLVPTPSYGYFVSYGDCIPRDSAAAHTLSLIQYAVAISEISFNKLSLDLSCAIGQLTQFADRHSSIVLQRWHFSKSNFGITIRLTGDAYYNETTLHFQESCRKLCLSDILLWDSDNNRTDCYDNLYLGCLPQEFRILPFEEVLIKDSGVEVTNLCNLLIDNRSGLRRLELSNVQVQTIFYTDRGDVTPAGFIRFLQEGFLLESLTLTNFSIEVEESVYRTHTAVLIGSQEIHQGLSKMLREFI